MKFILKIRRLYSEKHLRQALIKSSGGKGGRREKEAGREREEEVEMIVIMERCHPSLRGEKIDIAVDC